MNYYSEKNINTLIHEHIVVHLLLGYNSREGYVWLFK